MNEEIAYTNQNGKLCVIVKKGKEIVVEETDLESTD
jgi:hypothetical protein